MLNVPINLYFLSMLNGLDNTYCLSFPFWPSEGTKSFVAVLFHYFMIYMGIPSVVCGCEA